jgi:hypothetical protein
MGKLIVQNGKAGSFGAFRAGSVGVKCARIDRIDRQNGRVVDLLIANTIRTSTTSDELLTAPARVERLQNR